MATLKVPVLLLVLVAQCELTLYIYIYICVSMSWIMLVHWNGTILLWQRQIPMLIPQLDFKSVASWLPKCLFLPILTPSMICNSRCGSEPAAPNPWYTLRFVIKVLLLPLSPSHTLCTVGGKFIDISVQLISVQNSSECVDFM